MGRQSYVVSNVILHRRKTPNPNPEKEEGKILQMTGMKAQITRNVITVSTLHERSSSRAIPQQMKKKLC